jgi:hypothetical protein
MQGRRKKDEGREGKFFILHSTFFIRVAGGMQEIWKNCGYLRLFADKKRKLSGRCPTMGQNSSIPRLIRASQGESR